MKISEILVLTLCFIMLSASVARADSAILPVSVTLVKCGETRSDLPKMCKADSRCCTLLRADKMDEVAALDLSPAPLEAPLKTPVKTAKMVDIKEVKLASFIPVPETKPYVETIKTAAKPIISKVRNAFIVPETTTKIKPTAKIEAKIVKRTVTPFAQKANRGYTFKRVAQNSY